MRTVRVGFAELGLCPAAVRMDDGVIEINGDVWGRYDDFEQRFMLSHEEGHYKLQTDSEIEADAYALHKCYKTSDRSLKRSIETLYKAGIVDTRRYKALYTEALRIDWLENGNTAAKKELEELNITKMNNKMTLSSTPFIKYKRIDGEEGNKQDKQNRLPDKPEAEPHFCPKHHFLHCENGIITGIEIKRFYLSWETVAILLTTALLLYKLKK